ncbi:MAG: hypothetical protein LCI00_17895 [Chloroflexi bacterium]|nr:hypothetical protein [Chloroflexota bacterium]MCC6893849.1 hypothetical protein [Anaerolineae bacterium]
MQTQNSNWRTAFGITPGNPFAPFIIVSTAVVIIAALILLGLTFFGGTVNARYASAIIFMFVTGLSPVPIGLLVLGARNYARFQGITQGEYWVHWTYPADSRNREIYINGEGFYYPQQPRERGTFLSGVQHVEIQPGQPANLNIQYLHRRYYSSWLPPLKIDKQLVVPIPEGKEEEAQLLVNRFKKQLGATSAYVDDQWRIGWMMGGVIIVAVLISIVVMLPVQSQLDDQKWDQRDATATAQYRENAGEASIFLPPIRTIIEPQIERLKALPDGTMTAEEAGFDADSGVRAVHFGHCPPDDSFYVYVVMNREMLGRTYLSGPGGFNYTEATDRRYMDCGPEHWITTVPVQLTDGWYYGVIVYIQSTRTPRRMETMVPTLAITPTAP